MPKACAHCRHFTRTRKDGGVCVHPHGLRPNPYRFEFFDLTVFPTYHKAGVATGYIGDDSYCRNYAIAVAGWPDHEHCSAQTDGVNT